MVKTRPGVAVNGGSAAGDVEVRDAALVSDQGMGAAHLETNGAKARPRIVRCDAPPPKFLCRDYAFALPSGSNSYGWLLSYEGEGESHARPVFLGGGVALLCLMIAYARLTNRL